MGLFANLSRGNEVSSANKFLKQVIAIAKMTERQSLPDGYDAIDPPPTEAADKVCEIGRVESEIG